MGESGFQEERHPGRTWIILNTFGWGAFILIVGVMGSLAWQFSKNSVSANEFLSDTSVNIIGSSVIGGLCWGAILGRLQKSFLIRHLNLHGMHWTFATIIGLILYLAFQVSHQYLPLLLPPFYSSLIKILLNLAFYFVPPLALGIAQGSVLRRYFKGSGWWIAATTLGVGGAGWITSEIARQGLANRYIYLAVLSIAIYLIEGLAYGITTWIVLAFFTNQLAITNESGSQ